MKYRIIERSRDASPIRLMCRCLRLRQRVLCMGHPAAESARPGECSPPCPEFAISIPSPMVSAAVRGSGRICATPERGAGATEWHG